MGDFLTKWGGAVAGPKTRWLTVIVWVLIVGILSAVWPQVNEEEAGGSDLLPASAMSSEAAAILEEQFPNTAGVPLLIVWNREGGLEQADFTAVQELYAGLSEDPVAEQSLVPPLAELPPPALLQQASEDAEALTTPVFFNEEALTEEFQPALEELESRISALTGEAAFSEAVGEEGLRVRFTGPVGIQTDATELFSQADVTLLLATVALVLVLLVLLYRSPILALVPLIGVGFAYGVISPFLGFLADNGWITVDAQAVSIMTVLLFGAGTDYCLFLVSRYRDELQTERDKFSALKLAIANSGGAIAVSALTTAAGLLTLGLAYYASYDRFAVPFSTAIIIMGIAVLTLLPALLAIFGRAAFFPFVPRTEEMIREKEEKKGKKIRRLKTRSRFSLAAGKAVTEKPWPIIIACLILLGGLALIAPRIETTYGLLDSFPEEMPSREGFAIIAEHYPAGEIAPADVIADTEGEPVLLAETLAEAGYIASVSEPVPGEGNPDIQRVQVTFEEDPYADETVARIPELKAAAAEALEEAGVVDASEKVWIGGETAVLYDTQEITSRDQAVIIPVVLAIIAVLLLVYLRSAVAMTYLLATVVLSYFSALGLGWLIIHYGLGEPAMQGLIPLYAFVFLVALGGDYNIFMISSIWKNREKMPLKQAIAEGVSETSSVITSAGLILAGTFAVLAVLPLQVLVQFGIVTAVGILLDTFIVRPLLVPAITTVLGRYAFWPGRLWKK
ncbi:MMPL family transporter [Indiicoccus explosivorum]|uniref:MMPL family transporter n=1 Tax=Indiicoccus explosivorum TaxID=1917864 RepID=UPI000B44929E|nr:MMPL family transporter [Indiicoccus explosivorum]